MQNSNLSSKIFPNLREDWLSFIDVVSIDLQKMINTYNTDKQKVKNLDNVINKMTGIKDLCKDNFGEILNYRELFMYIDNSLESSFDALEYFKKQDNFDNIAVKTIYERIINSPKIMRLNSDYNSLAIKVSFDKERINRLSELVRGSNVDYTLIKELINKYKLNDDKKKNILFYPVVMLSIKQNEVKNNRENIEKRKQEKEKFYHDRFNELTKEYQKKKDSLKDLLINCFNTREKMDYQELDTYNSFINNPEEINEYEFSDDIKFKIYTLAFFKIKKDIENFIDGINDLLQDGNNLDDELLFFGEMINEFDSVANTLKSLVKLDKEIENDNYNNVFFALDAFNRLLIKEELLNSKNRSSIKAFIQKTNNISNSKIDGVKTSHMLGVDEAEKILGRNISFLVTSKVMLAYVMVGKNIFIITGDTTNTDRFDKVVNRIVEHNIISIRRQISLIEENNFDYIELQNRILKTIVEGETKENTKVM